MVQLRVRDLIPLMSSKAPSATVRLLGSAPAKSPAYFWRGIRIQPKCQRSVPPPSLAHMSPHFPPQNALVLSSSTFLKSPQQLPKAGTNLSSQGDAKVGFYFCGPTCVLAPAQLTPEDHHSPFQDGARAKTRLPRRCNGMTSSQSSQKASLDCSPV